MAKKVKDSWISGRVDRDVCERYQATLPENGQLKGQCLSFAAELWIALPQPLRKLLLADMMRIEDLTASLSDVADQMLANFTVQKALSDAEADAGENQSGNDEGRGRSAG